MPHRQKATRRLAAAAAAAAALMLLSWMPILGAEESDRVLAVIMGSSDHNARRGRVQLVRVGPAAATAPRCGLRVRRHPVSGSYVAAAFVPGDDSGDLDDDDAVGGSILSCGNVGDDRTLYCHSYDPGENTWSESIQMVRGGRAQAAHVWIDSQKWWVTGGLGRRRADSATSELYDANSGSFWAGPQLPEPLADHCMARVNRSHILLAAGETVPLSGAGTLSARAWMFDAVEKTFARLPDLSEARKAAACGVARRPGQQGDGDALVVVAGGVVQGGEEEEGGQLEYSNSVEVFDLSTWSWRAGPDLPAALASPASLDLGPDSFLLAGGYLDSSGSGSSRRSPYSSRLLQFDLYRTWWSAIFSPSTYYERWSERPERLEHGTAGCPMFWVPTEWCS